MKRSMKRIAILLILASALSCARYVIHPGAVNTFDSQTYDVLIAAKTTIETARAQFASKTLPDSLKPAFNGLVDAYNIAYPVYKLWHEAAAKGQPADQYIAALNKNLVDVNRALAAFKGGR